MSASSIILVLGMHRSGTSCLAGGLEACGLHLGGVSRRGRFNAKGNRESRQIWKLHDQILGLHRAAWHNPPENVQVHPAFLQKMEAVVSEQQAANRICGFKDPRTILFLSTWKQILNESVRCVGSFRHPLSVAHSLAKRDGLPVSRGLELWNHYNRRLVDEHQQRPFPIVEYCLDDHKHYCGCVARIALDVGLRPRLRRIGKFVARDLQHHQAGIQAVPRQCRDLYEYLLANAAQQSQTTDCEQDGRALISSHVSRGNPELPEHMGADAA